MSLVEGGERLMKKYVLVPLLTVVLLLPVVLAVHSSSRPEAVSVGTVGQEEASVLSDVAYWETFQLTDNELTDFAPQIHNGMIAWLGRDDGSDYEIFFYDGTSIAQITENEYDDFAPQIHNGMVTWYGWDGNDYEIFLYDGTSVTQITDNEVTDQIANIHNGLVTWVRDDNLHDYEILLYDGTSEVQVASSEFALGGPQIHNGMVTWNGWDGNDYEIFLYDGTSVTQITDNDYDDRAPQIHNGMLTWERIGYDGWTRGISFYDGTSVIQLTDIPGYYDAMPQIHNGMVTWYGWDGSDMEIFLYDGTSVIQITDNAITDAWPQIHNDIIVWNAGYIGGFMIFLYDGTSIIEFEPGFRPQIHNNIVTWDTWDGNDNEILFAHLILTTIQATVDFDPNTLNLKCKGKWVTTYIELPTEYNVADIDVTTVLLQGVIPAATSPTNIGDFDSDGVPDLMVKFDRAALQSLVSVGESVEVTISGSLVDGTDFEGTDTIRVIDEGNEHVNEEDPSAVS